MGRVRQNAPTSVSSREKASASRNTACTGVCTFGKARAASTSSAEHADGDSSDGEDEEEESLTDDDDEVEEEDDDDDDDEFGVVAEPAGVRGGGVSIGVTLSTHACAAAITRSSRARSGMCTHAHCGGVKTIKVK